jgi:hypothetical protein
MDRLVCSIRSTIQGFKIFSFVLQYDVLRDVIFKRPLKTLFFIALLEYKLIYFFMVRVNSDFKMKNISIS